MARNAQNATADTMSSSDRLALQMLHAEWRRLDTCLSQLTSACYRDTVPPSAEELGARYAAHAMMVRRRADVIEQITGVQYPVDSQVLKPEAPENFWTKIKPTRALRSLQAPGVSAESSLDADNEYGSSINAEESRETARAHHSG